MGDGVLCPHFPLKVPQKENSPKPFWWIGAAPGCTLCGQEPGGRSVGGLGTLTIWTASWWASCGHLRTISKHLSDHTLRYLFKNWNTHYDTLPWLGKNYGQSPGFWWSRSVTSLHITSKSKYQFYCWLKKLDFSFEFNFLLNLIFLFKLHSFCVTTNSTDRKQHRCPLNLSLGVTLLPSKSVFGYLFWSNYMIEF